MPDSPTAQALTGHITESPIAIWNIILCSLLAASTYYIIWSKWTSKTQSQRHAQPMETAQRGDHAPKNETNNVSEIASIISDSEHGKYFGEDKGKPQNTSTAASSSPAVQIPKRKLPPTDYTVGWICAISPEHVAAQLFLDEIHEGPEFISSSDDNVYTLGRCGNHNIVIAVLPEGEYGISAATGVAKDLLHSFPSVRIGLMVGIGGGAPSRHDIRLGDVVVSAPRDGNGGVFQYDFGKTIQDQVFHTTGFLNQPPTLLRKAVSTLKSQYQIHGHQYAETIGSILQRYPRLQGVYDKPDSESDVLYQSSFTHPENSTASCRLSCQNDPRMIIGRPQRAKSVDSPTIHYGLIASANNLMKDARIRDQLAAAKDVLCFEMEAAGLMNQFPCLVIRGICDYSDSHKNKEWQGYAAMVAAAYAKDLLNKIAPTQVEAERTIRELLSDILVPMSSIDTNVKNLHSKWDENEGLGVLEWLTRVDYGAQQSDYFSRRENGTGQWLLNHRDFQSWVETSGKTLFCPGIPGAGKTIMTSTVVDNIVTRFSKDEDVGIAYVYCDFKRQDDQSALNLLSSMLKQLCRGRPSLPDFMRVFHDKHKKHQTRPSLGEIMKNLHSVAAMYSRVFIIVDALDECQSSDGCREQFLRNIFSLQNKVQSNIFATSRHVHEIEEQFSGSTSLQIRAMDEDVHAYLASQIYKLPPFVRRDVGLQNRIKTTIAKTVDGMFLLAPLHIGALAEEPTAGHLELALQKLPSGLDETYEGAFARIEKQGVGFQALARRILSWVIYARRHLSATELQLALAIEPGKSKLDEKFIPDIEIIGSICAGLITFDKKCDVVRLVHHTTQEYCKRTLTRWLPHGAADITKACLTYLCFDRFSSGPCLRGSEYRERLALNKLYHYAAQNWGHHARYDSNSCPEVIDFLERQGCLEASTQTLFSGEALAPESGYHWEEVTHRFPRGFTGLHMAAYFGIEKVVESLLQKGANTGAITNTDSADSHNCSPLFWAAERGHANVVELLLKTGKVNANSKGEYSWTPLHWASAKGYKTIVKLLLENGKVDPDSKDEDSQTPLSWAAKKGHETIVELLLETGNVDVDSKDKDNQTPLSRAAKSGHESVVKLLLNTEKVDVDSRDGYGQTPLSWAAEKGHETVVKLLLETGKVDADSKDNLSWTPFSYASRGGHTAVVKLLLETEKVDINSQGRNSRTSLSWAAEKGHEAVVSLLLTEKVDVDLGDKYGRTPLSYAAKGGHTAVVKLLLETGNVHTDSMSKDSQTRLSLASAKGYKDVVRLLSNKGADLDVTKTTG